MHEFYLDKKKGCQNGFMASEVAKENVNLNIDVYDSSPKLGFTLYTR